MKNIGWMIGSLFLVLAPVIAAAPNWAWFASPVGVSALLASVGGVLVAAFKIDGASVIAKVTGNGKQPLPPDVN